MPCTSAASGAHSTMRAGSRRMALSLTRRRTTNSPRSFRIGGDSLIKGWEQGIPGMKVGELRKMIIPPELGYGKTGKPTENSSRRDAGVRG